MSSLAGKWFVVDGLLQSEATLYTSSTFTAAVGVLSNLPWPCCRAGPGPRQNVAVTLCGELVEVDPSTCLNFAGAIGQH